MSKPKQLSPLTQEQCNEFRRLPLAFDDMVRAIHAAGAASVAALDRAKAGYLAGRLEQLAPRFIGAGDVAKDLGTAAALLREIAQ